MKKLPFNTKKLLTNTALSFGTSGVRGLETDFNEEICAAFTIAFIEVMKRHFSFDSVAIGMDNRPSSPDIAHYCLKTITAQGLTAINYSVLPTPALAYTCMLKNIPCIMVTGSHIPFDRNGLKFYRPDGEINKQDEFEINNVNVDFEVNFESAIYNQNESAINNYIARYTSLFDANKFSGKKIGIYEHSSSGRDIYYKIFEQLGAEVTSLERSEGFVPIDTEAVTEEDKLKAIKWSNDYHFDMIFSTDGDGDRPLIADEKGNWLRGDILGLLTARHLKIKAVAVPVSCNTAIEKSNSFDASYRTKIGSPYVIEQFEMMSKRHESYSGFEANGGFLLGSDIELNQQRLTALPTRDAVLPAIALLHATGEKNISDLISALPKRFTASDRIQNFATAQSQNLINKYKTSPEQLLSLLKQKERKVTNIDFTDGLRVTLDNSDIIHLRPSGNAPELRCYAESSSDELANRLVSSVLTQIKTTSA